MKIITVNINQSIWDIANQEYGSEEGVQQLILDNPDKVNFDDALVPGTKLKITTEPTDKSIVEYFKKKEYKPSTAIDDTMLSDGIDYDEIDDTLIL